MKVFLKIMIPNMALFLALLVLNVVFVHGPFFVLYTILILTSYLTVLVLASKLDLMEKSAKRACEEA